jgi:hypothetical protein
MADKDSQFYLDRLLHKEELSSGLLFGLAARINIPDGENSNIAMVIGPVVSAPGTIGETIMTNVNECKIVNGEYDLKEYTTGDNITVKEFVLQDYEDGNKIISHKVEMNPEVLQRLIEKYTKIEK